MAKRNKESLKEEEKRRLTKSNMRKLMGIFRFTLPYRNYFIIGLLSLLISSFTLLAFPYLAGALLDVAVGKEKEVLFITLSSINQVAIVLLGILFLQSIFSFIRVYTFSIVSERSLADVRTHLFQKIMWLPMRYLDNKRIGELISRITSDVATLQDTFSFALAELLRQASTLLLGIVLIIWLTPKLAVFMLLTFPVLVILAFIFGKYIRKLSRKTQDKVADATVIVEESLQSISVVKAFTNETLEIGRYIRSIGEVVEVSLKTARLRGLFISFIIFALVGGMVAVGWYGALLIQRNVLTVGELFSFVIYTAFIGGSIAGLGDIYSQIQRAIGASERILEILEESDEMELTGENIKLRGAIEFENVSFQYPSRPEFPVLRGLNFVIEQGEKIALVGPSGSGKSTIINLLMRFYKINEGKIYVDGKSIQDYSLTGYRHNIGIVPQEVILFGGTIQQNIAYGKPDASYDEIRKAAQQANALEFIESFPEKFNTVVGDRGIKLSGGQRQRIAIARAILKNPSILILDEATSSLDAHSEKLVQEALETLMEGRTTVIIAHRLSTIRKVDRIFVIKEGGLAETGSHAELTKMNGGIYTSLLNLQLQVV